MVSQTEQSLYLTFLIPHAAEECGKIEIDYFMIVVLGSHHLCPFFTPSHCKSSSSRFEIGPLCCCHLYSNSVGVISAVDFLH